MALEEKGRGEEQIHAKKDEQEFRALARRNKLLGLWLAEIFGIADAESYAKDVVISDLDEPGDADILRKVMKDIAHYGADLSEADIVTKLSSLLAQAKTEV